MKNFVAMMAAVLLLSPVSAISATYNLDSAHTTIGFKVKHLMISNVSGVFEKFKGQVVADEKDITKSKVKASIDVTSINTNIPARDKHLRSGDFFDVARFPTMIFESTKVEKIGDGKLKVTGNLTLKGVTRPVVLDVTGPTPEIKSPQGVIKRGISATAVINRQDFGVSWNKKLDAGGVVISDEVQIFIDAELDRQ